MTTVIGYVESRALENYPRPLAYQTLSLELVSVLGEIPKQAATESLVRYAVRRSV